MFNIKFIFKIRYCLICIIKQKFVTIEKGLIVLAMNTIQIFRNILINN